MTERQWAILSLSRRRGAITNGDARELFPHLSSEALRKDLARLVTLGKLVRYGTKRGTTHTLAET